MACKLYLEEVAKIQVKLKYSRGGGREHVPLGQMHSGCDSFSCLLCSASKRRKRTWTQVAVACRVRLPGAAPPAARSHSGLVTFLAFAAFPQLWRVYVFCIPSLLQLKQLLTHLISFSKPHEAGFTTILQKLKHRHFR